MGIYGKWNGAVKDGNCAHESRTQIQWMVRQWDPREEELQQILL
jgi:hypothetical protein